MLVTERVVEEGVNPEDLSELWPLVELDPEDLAVVAEHAYLEHAPTGTTLVESGTTDTWALYLLSGKVHLSAPDGREMVVESGSDKARYPISNLRPHRYTIKALSKVDWLRIDKVELDGVVNKTDVSGAYEVTVLSTVDTGEDSDELSDFPLYRDIYQDIVDDKLVIPSLPDVAVQIQRVIEQEDADAAKISKIIQTDPAIAAKVVKTANSAFYRGQQPIESCNDAVVRLGTNTIKNLVTSFVMRDLFKAKDAALKKRMTDLWQHSTLVAAVSYVLGRMTRGLNPEHALLAGLLHDIGVLMILSYAEKHPELVADPRELDATIAQLRGPLGAMILEKWQFPEGIVTAAREAEDWHRDSGPRADYGDLIVVAQLHSFVGTPEMWALPRIYEVPAFNKMASGQLSPELSLMILDEAKQQIAETHHWLTN